MIHTKSKSNNYVISIISMRHSNLESKYISYSYKRDVKGLDSRKDVVFSDNMYDITSSQFSLPVKQS